MTSDQNYDCYCMCTDEYQVTIWFSQFQTVSPIDKHIKIVVKVD